MERSDRVGPTRLFGFVLDAMLLACVAAAQPATPTPVAYAALPGEIPARFEIATGAFDYVRRDVMIPMRDGVTLHTVILVPKGAKRAPMLLTRTPYDATAMTARAQSPHLGPIARGLRQRHRRDRRGRLHPRRPGRARQARLRGRLRDEPARCAARRTRPRSTTPPTPTTPSTGWSRTSRRRNGRVGILGISYDGFLAADGARRPAPGAQGGGADEPDGRRLDRRRLVPQRRVPPAEPALHLRPGGEPRRRRVEWWTGHYDDYDAYLGRARRASSAGATGWSSSASGASCSRTRAYDAFWHDQAVDRVLAARPLEVPVMLVHSLWDQEDIYGALAVYRALEPKDTGNDKVFLVIGPWHHGQEIHDGGALGPLRFGSDTALYFRQRDPAAVPRPLPEGRRAGRRTSRRSTAFETGTQRLAAAAGVAGRLRERLRDQARRRSTSAPGGSVGFAPPKPGEAPFDEYVSDPAKPVPYLPRPVRASGSAWARWLVDRPARGVGPARRAHLRLRRPRRSRSRSPASRWPTWSPRPAARTPTGWSS